jgi:hypothetical protein
MGPIIGTIIDRRLICHRMPGLSLRHARNRFHVPFLNDLERNMAFGLSHLENLGTVGRSLASLRLMVSGTWSNTQKLKQIQAFWQYCRLDSLVYQNFDDALTFRVKPR